MVLILNHLLTAICILYLFDILVNIVTVRDMSTIKNTNEKLILCQIWNHTFEKIYNSIISVKPKFSE